VFNLLCVQDVTQGLGAGLQSEVLDDATTRALFVDVDPAQKGQGGQGRKFCMSFDVRQYDPAEMAVRSEDGCLVVEAKHLEQDSSGSKVQLVDPFNLRHYIAGIATGR